MSHKRRKHFVDPEVQGALARRLVLQWFSYTMVAAALAVVLTWFKNPFAPLTDTVYAAWTTYGPMLLLLVCMAPVFIFDSVKLSNRFAGPISRIRSVTQALARGESPRRVKFRGSDFWQGLANDFNAVIDRLEAAERDPSPKPADESTLLAAASTGGPDA